MAQSGARRPATEEHGQVEAVDDTVTIQVADHWVVAVASPAMPTSARVMASMSPSLAPVPLSQAVMRARLQGTWARPKSL